MSTNHTDHYNLSLWEASDQVQRTEFNENHAKIDAALGTLAAGQLRLHAGFYRGTGSTTMTLTFPFPPKVILIHKTFQYTEYLLIVGEKSAHSSVGDAYGKDTCWCAPRNYNYTWTLENNTLTINASTSSQLTTQQQQMYAMNRGNYDYMYIALG